MNTAHNADPADRQGSLKQRARASRRSADQVIQPAPAPLGEAVPKTCAAARLGEILEAAWSRYDELKERTTAENESVLESLEQHCLRQIDELELALSYSRAASPTGILTQLALAFSATDLAVTGSDRSTREAAKSRAERCLHSVAAAVCGMTGIDREGSCADRYMSAWYDQLAFLSPEVVG